MITSTFIAFLSFTPVCAFQGNDNDLSESVLREKLRTFLSASGVTPAVTEGLRFKPGRFGERVARVSLQNYLCELASRSGKVTLVAASHAAEEPPGSFYRAQTELFQRAERVVTASGASIAGWSREVLAGSFDEVPTVRVLYSQVVDGYNFVGPGNEVLVEFSKSGGVLLNFRLVDTINCVREPGTGTSESRATDIARIRLRDDLNSNHLPSGWVDSATPRTHFGWILPNSSFSSPLSAEGNAGRAYLGWSVQFGDDQVYVRRSDGQVLGGRSRSIRR